MAAIAPGQPPGIWRWRKKSAPNASASVNLFEGGRIQIGDEPVKLLIRMAFRVLNAQIAGRPNRVDAGAITLPSDLKVQNGFRLLKDYLA